MVRQALRLSSSCFDSSLGLGQQAKVCGFIRNLIVRLPGPRALEVAGDLLGRPVPLQLGQYCPD